MPKSKFVIWICVSIFGIISIQIVIFRRPICKHSTHVQSVNICNTLPEAKKTLMFDDRKSMLTSREMLYVVGEEDMQKGEDLDGFSQRYSELIRSHVVVPSPGPINLQKPPSDDETKHFSQDDMQQSRIIDERLRGRRGGFFMECGAWDGEEMSNTLFFELHRNWTGLLVEVNPSRCRTLLGKNRQVYAMCACLSPSRRPSQMVYAHSDIDFIAGIVGHMSRNYSEAVKSSNNPIQSVVQCFPLNDILSALEVRLIDYFSLDVDGAELDILKSIDWSRVRIDTLSVEFNDHIAGIRQYMNNTRLYREVLQVGVDLIFERLDLN